MYITKNSKSKFYQVVYFKNGRLTSKSTKTTNKKKAQNFLSNFSPNIPKIIKEKPNEIALKKFYAEYLQHMELSKSKTYLKSVRLSFSQLIKFAGDISLSHITIRLIDSLTLHSNKLNTQQHSITEHLKQLSQLQKIGSTFHAILSRKLKLLKHQTKFQSLFLKQN